MSTQKLFKKGTTLEHQSYTGDLGEITVDTDKRTVVVHDGVTTGGHPIGTLTTNSSSGPNQSISFSQSGIHRANCTGSDPVITFSFVNPDNIARVDLILDIDEYAPGLYPTLVMPSNFNGVIPLNLTTEKIAISIFTDDGGQTYHSLYTYRY